MNSVVIRAVANTNQAMTWARRKPPKINVLSPRKASRKRREEAVSAANVRNKIPAGGAIFRNQRKVKIRREAINS
jgi:hypothetical protein